MRGAAFFYCGRRCRSGSRTAMNLQKRAYESRLRYAPVVIEPRFTGRSTK
jgi:hypothetical protein